MSEYSIIQRAAAMSFSLNSCRLVQEPQKVLYEKRIQLCSRHFNHHGRDLGISYRGPVASYGAQGVEKIGNRGHLAAEMLLPSLMDLGVTGQVILQMMFKCRDNGKLRNSRRTEEILGAAEGVKSHELPFLFVTLARLGQDLFGNEQLAHVMKHGCNADLMKQLPVYAKRHGLCEVENADVGGMGERIFVNCFQGRDSQYRVDVSLECLYETADDFIDTIHSQLAMSPDPVIDLHQPMQLFIRHLGKGRQLPKLRCTAVFILVQGVTDFDLAETDMLCRTCFGVPVAFPQRFNQMAQFIDRDACRQLDVPDTPGFEQLNKPGYV